VSRTVGFFAAVLRRGSANSHEVYVRFLHVVEELVGEESGLDAAEQVAQIRNALAAAEGVLAEIWGAQR
jgi:hypothetical protein